MAEKKSLPPLKITSITCTRSIQGEGGCVTLTLTSPLEEGMELGESSLANLLLAMEVDMACIRAAYQAGIFTQEEHDQRVLEARRRFLSLVHHLQTP